MMEFTYVLRPPRATFLTDSTRDERSAVAQHFEYLKKLAEQGVVILAGRSEDATFGIVIFRAADESAAKHLMGEDPAIRAGVFAAQLHPFRVALFGNPT
jgi:uncharacterized protein YciI